MAKQFQEVQEDNHVYLANKFTGKGLSVDMKKTVQISWNLIGS
jgi:hypothetical protein